MKFRTFIFSILAISFIATMCADPTSVQGGGSYGQEKLESLTGIGVVKLNGTEIDNQLQVNGSLLARDAEIGFIDIIGEANLIDSHVKKGSNVFGQIQTVETTFDEPLTILSQRAIFIDSKLNKILVKQDSASHCKQIIELRKRTIVDGPIHFESGKGEVFLYPGSQVLGIVTGGKIVKKH